MRYVVRSPFVEGATRYRPVNPISGVLAFLLPKEYRCKQMEIKFVFDLTTAHDLWWRTDLGHAPRDTKHVAQALMEAGIKVHQVSGGWLECAPRPVGIFEALTGKLAPSDWVEQFNCPPEQPGRVLKLLVQKGVPVCDSELSLLGESMKGAIE